MERSHKAFLQNNHVLFVDHVEPIGDILDSLLESGIFTDNDAEEISSGRTRRDRCQTLLHMLPIRGPNAFKAFIKALKYAGLDDLVGKFPEIDEDATVVKEMKEAPFPVCNKRNLCENCRWFWKRYGRRQGYQNPDFKSFLDNHLCTLLDNLEPKHVIDQLFQDGIVLHEEIEIINNGISRQKRCEYLFKILLGKKEKPVTTKLLNSLTNKYKFIVDSIEHLQESNVQDRTHVKFVFSGDDDGPDRSQDQERGPFMQRLKINYGNMNSCQRLKAYSEGSKAYRQPLQVTSHDSEPYMQVMMNYLQSMRPDNQIAYQGMEYCKPEFMPVSQSSDNKTQQHKLSSEDPQLRMKLLQSSYVNGEQCVEFLRPVFMSNEGEDCVDGFLNAGTTVGIGQQKPEVSCSLLESPGISSNLLDSVVDSSHNLRSEQTERVLPNKPKENMKRHRRLKKVRDSNKGKQSSNSYLVDCKGNVKDDNVMRTVSSIRAKGQQKKVISAYDLLSNLLNDGEYVQFDLKSSDFLKKHSENGDMHYVISYLQVCKHLNQSDCDGAKPYMTTAIALAQHTSNPHYALIEMLSTKTRKYIIQKKLGKLETVLDDIKMMVETDPTGIPGRVAGWLYLNDGRFKATELNCLNLNKPNAMTAYDHLFSKARDSFQKSIEYFRLEKGKDGYFGFAYAQTLLIILLMRCGDNGKTMGMIEPPKEHISSAAKYIQNLENTDIPIVSFLRISFCLAKCDYKFRISCMISAAEHARTAYNLATELGIMEFKEHAQNRLLYLSIRTDVVRIREIQEIESNKNLLEDTTSSGVVVDSSTDS